MTQSISAVPRIIHALSSILLTIPRQDILVLIACVLLRHIYRWTVASFELSIHFTEGYRHTLNISWRSFTPIIPIVTCNWTMLRNVTYSHHPLGWHSRWWRYRNVWGLLI